MVPIWLELIIPTTKVWYLSFMKFYSRNLAFTICALLFFYLGKTTLSLGKPPLEMAQEHLQKMQEKSISLGDLISPKEGFIYLFYEEDSPKENEKPVRLETHLCGRRLKEMLPAVEERLKRHLEYGVAPVCRFYRNEIPQCEATIQTEYGSQLTLYFVLSKPDQLQVRAVTVQDFAASPKVMRRQGQQIQKRLNTWWRKVCP